MTAVIATSPRFKFFDNAGSPAVDYLLYTYLAGTTTPATTWQDKAQAAANTNPIELDANGECLLWLAVDQEYKLVLKTPGGAEVRTTDNISSYEALLRIALLDADGVLLVGNAADKRDLASTASGKGAALVGRASTVVSSIAALRALLKTSAGQHAFATGYYTQGDGGGGAYWYDSSDTTSVDNGGSIIVATDGGRWKLAFTGIISVKQFGAKVDGVTEDYVAVQATLTAGFKNVYVPSGTCLVNTGLVVPGGTNSPVLLFGDGAYESILQTTSDITLISGGNRIKLHNLKLDQAGAAFTGVGVSSSVGGAYWELHGVAVNGFSVGVSVVKTLWSSFRDVYLNNNAIGMELGYGAGGSWNVGWWNNQITFDNVLCNGGEIGIKAACMGATFNGITTQGQIDRGLGNVPAGKGTGLWIEGPAATTLGRTRNNVIVNHYAEGTERPIYLKNGFGTMIVEPFAQGGSPYPCWLEADDAGDVDVIGRVNGLNTFTVAAILTNTTLYGNLNVSFNAAAGAFLTLNTGGIYTESRAIRKNSNFYFADSTAGTTEINYTLENYHHYRVSLGCLYNGASVQHHTFNVFRWNSDALTSIVADDANTSFTLAVSGNKFQVTTTGAFAHIVYVSVEDVSALTGKTTATAAQTY